MRQLILPALIVAGVALLSSPEKGEAQDQGGTFIMAMSGEPQSLVGFLATDTNASMIANNVFSKLVSLNPDMTPRPDLAESWTVSEDGLTYTFNLVTDARWHDGEPVTAEDVVFTVEDIVAEHFPRASSWVPNVESVTATGEHQVNFQLLEPYAPFMTLMGSSLGSGMLIMPKHIYEGMDIPNNEANFAPIGSGPFRFGSWNRGAYIELVRNDDYFVDGQPYLDRVIGQIVPDASSRLLAFEQGEIDFLHMYILPNDQIGRLKGGRALRDRLWRQWASHERVSPLQLAGRPTGRCDGPAGDCPLPSTGMPFAMWPCSVRAGPPPATSTALSSGSRPTSSITRTTSRGRMPCSTRRATRATGTASVSR